MLAGKLCRIAIPFQPHRNSMSFSKLAITLFAIFSIAAVSTSAKAQQLESVGLKQQWFSHSGVAAGGKLADWYLDIDENKGTTYFEITGGNYSETISENDLGPNGKRMGIDFGLEMANIKAEVMAARLKSDTGQDVKVSVNQYTLPKSTLYTQTDTGIVRSIDAETGKTRWSVNVGVGTTESLGVVGSGDHVAVLKGSLVYCLNSETGGILWSHRSESAASAPPQIDDGEIYVPLINGRVERFNIEEEGFNTVSFVSGGAGATTSRPAISTNSLCWSNYSGTVSVAARSSDRGMPGFQLNAGGPVFGVPQYKDGVYFVTSIDSYVYALSEDRGSLIWENSTGFEVTQAPFLVGNHVYVINDLNQLARFDAKTGQISAHWQKPRPGIGTFVGASEKKIYTVDKIGQMKVLDQDTGTVTGSASFGDVSLILPNTKNDRIYILNKSGTIRCFREVNSVKPFFHSDEFKTMEPKMEGKDGASEKAMEGPGPDDEDPFGNNNDAGETNDGDENPFGGAAGDSVFGGGDDDKEKADDASPENPFGDQDESEDADPFGASEDNPFGDG